MAAPARIESVRAVVSPVDRVARIYGAALAAAASEKTAADVTGHVLEKLRFRNRAEAAAFAARHLG